MEIFTQDHKMVELIRENPNLLPVISRFGILLGFGDKTIRAVCTASGIHTDFFLAIVNTYENEAYFPEQELVLFSPLLVVDYLKKTHIYYTSYVLPKLEKLIKQLIGSSTGKQSELQIIEIFYKKYKKELMRHINEEEVKVFPYVIKLVSNEYCDDRFRIHTFKKEHSNVEIKLNDLTSLVIKYMEPVYDEHLCNEFLITLFNFGNDLKDHARIEDNILVPQVKIIERGLSK